MRRPGTRPTAKSRSGFEPVFFYDNQAMTVVAYLRMKVSTGFRCREGVRSAWARVTPTEVWGTRLQAPPRRWRFGALDARLFWRHPCSTNPLPHPTAPNSGGESSEFALGTCPTIDDRPRAHTMTS